MGSHRRLEVFVEKVAYWAYDLRERVPPAGKENMLQRVCATRWPRPAFEGARKRYRPCTPMPLKWISLARSR